MDLNRQLDCSQARILLDTDGRLKQQQLHYETSMLHFLSKECFPLPSSSGLVVEQPQQLDSTFIVFPRAEYDLIKKDLQIIRQSFTELRTTISTEVQALKEESGQLLRQMEKCRCVDADHQQHQQQHLGENQDQRKNHSQLWATEPNWDNHRSAFTNLSMMGDSSGLCSPNQTNDRGGDDRTHHSSVNSLHHIVQPQGNIFCSQNTSESHHQSNNISPLSVDSKQVQLLPNYDIYVNKLNLQIIINEGMSHKEGGALYVLRRLIPLVFTWDELACSRGQGLNCKTNDVNSSHKFPLDPTRVVACKTYMRKFCLEYGIPEPSERSINQTFSHQVNYARRRLRGVNESPLCKDNRQRLNRKIKIEPNIMQDVKFMQM